MRRGLLPVAAVFVLFGCFWGIWAVSTADIVLALGLGPGGFGALLALGLTASAGTNAVTASLVERWGTGTTLALSLVLWSAALLVMALVTASWAFGVAMIVTLTLGGAVDVTINIASAAALSDRPGDLVRFHGLFTVGAVAGAAATAILDHEHWRWQTGLVGVAVVALVVAVVCTRVELPAGEAGESHGLLHAMRTIRREHLVVLAFVFAGSAMVEGGIETWGVLFLRRQLATGVLVGATAYVVGQSLAALSRFLLGPRAGGLGARRGASIGAAGAATGLLLLALGPTPVAMVGLALAAASIALCWPLLVSIAGEGRERPAAVVGGVTAVGYLGLVVGPPLVGFIADAANLRVGLAALAAVGFLVAVRARRV
jgi:MFS family permease